MARKLNYVPNEMARSLRLQQSGVIGLVTRGLGYNWVEDILVGLLPVFDQAGYTPLISVNYWDGKRERRELDSLLQRRVEGIICLPMPYNRATYQDIMRRGIPLLFLADVLEDLTDVSYVLWDTRAATRVAVRHLIETGRRRIGFIGADHRTYWTRARYQAYEEVMREAGLQIHPEWIAWELFDFSLQARRKVESMVDRVFADPSHRPEALYVSTDALATLILDILTRRGIPVPGEVAIVGLGDLFMSDHSGISLTTVREPTQELGRLAAQTMLELIRQPGRGPIQHKIESNELIVRRSTQGRAGDL
jgi:LacI family transcriptional regulator